MSNSPAWSYRISTKFFLFTLLVSVGLGFALGMSVLHGHVKAIIYVTAICMIAAKTCHNVINDRKILILIVIFVTIHLGMIFVMPKDDFMPGGFMIPVGVMDYLIFYFIFLRIARNI
jgi:hypothetical protein